MAVIISRKGKRQMSRMMWEDFNSVMGISNLPQIKRPIVIVAGTVGVPALEGEKYQQVRSVHGTVYLRHGKLGGQDVVVIDRHRSAYFRNRRWYNQPKDVLYEAHAAVIASLNPKAVITLHAVGANPKASKGLWARIPSGLRPNVRKLGQLSLVEGAVFGTARDAELFPEKLVDKLSGLGYDPATIIHTGLPRERLQGSSLAAIAKSAIREAGHKFGRGIVVQSNIGPNFESEHQVLEAIQRGASAFAMTHYTEAGAIAQALKAVGSKAELISLGLVTNYPAGLGPVSHEGVKEVTKRSQPMIEAFFRELISRVGKAK